jgi:hypothetical protein
MPLPDGGVGAVGEFASLVTVEAGDAALRETGLSEPFELRFPGMLVDALSEEVFAGAAGVSVRASDDFAEFSDEFVFFDLAGFEVASSEVLADSSAAVFAAFGDFSFVGAPDDVSLLEGLAGSEFFDEFLSFFFGFASDLLSFDGDSLLVDFFDFDAFFVVEVLVSACCS